MSVFCAGVFLVGAAVAAADERPNIVIILADDLGYQDIGVYGCPDVPTPHIDSLATAGVRLTDGYATHPFCCPSRAGLLSGRYQHRFGFEANSGPELYASPKFGIPTDVPLLSERLREAGYRTSFVGKWHVGFREGLRPHERGFDESYGFLSGARTYYPEGRRGRDDSPLLRDGVEATDETEYLTDAFGREAVDFIGRSADSGPFFLFLSFNAVHTPLEATEAYEARFGGIANPRRRTFAGMLSAMDDAVGRVLDALRDADEEENTLVVFYSDNGGPTRGNTSRNDPLRGFKGDVFEGGIRVPFVLRWPGKIPAGSTYREMVMGFDVTATALAAAGVDTARADLDGVDLIPFLAGDARGRPHEALFWRSGRSHAARLGDYKLVSDRGSAPMLFLLSEDIAESRDVAAGEATKLAELQAAYDAWSAGMMKPLWVRQDRRNAEPGGKLIAGAPAVGIGEAAFVGGRLQQLFQQQDANGDGKLTGDELEGRPRVQRADADGDGAVTLEELTNAFRRTRGRRGGQP